jgi:hypothetical protein
MGTAAHINKIVETSIFPLDEERWPAAFRKEPGLRERDPPARNGSFSRSDGCPLAPSNDIYFLAADLWLSQSVSNLWKTTSS